MKKLQHCPHCGCLLTKARSLKAHRHFFAIINRAFENWPENHHFQPDSPDHLRAWLQVMAKHRDIMIRDPGEKDVDFIVRVVRQTRISGYAFPAEYNRQIAVAFPRSVNWSTLDQRDFAEISDVVYMIIEETLQMSIADIKREFANNEHKNLANDIKTPIIDEFQTP